MKEEVSRPHCDSPLCDSRDILGHLNCAGLMLSYVYECKETLNWTALLRAQPAKLYVSVSIGKQEKQS